MERDLNRLSSNPFDLVVIGGGVLGACVAWDAATRGFSVALVERNDFGGGTTANSGKVAHGGLRCLQHFDLRGAREACCEQATLWRLAPGLLRPVAFAVPPASARWWEPFVLRAAAHAWRGFRAIYSATDGLPDPRYLATQDDLNPALRSLGLDRALLFYDFQIRSPERLTLAFAAAADAAGAAVANHLEVIALRVQGGAVRGVQVRDSLTSAEFAIRSRMVICAAGPWAPRLWHAASLQCPQVAFAKGMHVVVDRAEPPTALALPWPDQRTAGRLHTPVRRVFVMPWEGRTLIGATYAPFADVPDRCYPLPDELDEFLSALQERWPRLEVTRSQVRYAYAGLYPIFNRKTAPRHVFAASRRPLIVDHGRMRGPSGLISTVSVKLTTARRLAERVVDLARRYLNREGGPCVTGAAPELSRARMASVPDAINSDPSRWSPHTLKRMAAVAVEEEMAMTISDVLLRRTMLGHLGYPGPDRIRCVGEALAQRLGWSSQELARQVTTLQRVYERIGLKTRASGP